LILTALLYPDIVERIYKRVEKRGDCLICLYKPTINKYTQIWLGEHFYRKEGTHRVVWELIHGPIKDGMQILHTCDIRPCIEDTHLFEGTVQDNQRDKMKKGRGWNQILTVQDVIDIRRALSEGERSFVVANLYNVSACTIRDIQTRRTWSHV
jgi:hypothetical protein